jgi:hypothetical protein
LRTQLICKNAQIEILRELLEGIQKWLAYI